MTPSILLMLLGMLVLIGSLYIYLHYIDDVLREIERHEVIINGCRNHITVLCEEIERMDEEIKALCKEIREYERMTPRGRIKAVQTADNSRAHDAEVRNAE